MAIYHTTQVDIWDISSLDIVWTIKLKESEIICMTIESEYQKLLVSFANKTLIIYDIFLE